jgi:glutathione S-transferase
MKIYGANLSPFVRKVMAICSIKGLEYDHEMVMPGDASPEYLKISPLGKIPAFEDGDLAMSDSSVICEYLEEQYPSIGVLPPAPADRARSRWLEEFADSKLVESVAPYFFERKIKKMRGMGEPDEEKLARLAAEDIPNCLDYLESQIPENGFLFGDIGIADVAICCPLVSGSYGGYNVDAGVYPKTAAFLERVISDPTIAPILEREQAMLAGLG